MTAKPPRPESLRSDKAGVDGTPDPRSPMDRFRDLARKLVNVPREDINREEERHKELNTARKKKKASV